MLYMGYFIIVGGHKGRKLSFGTSIAFGKAPPRERSDVEAETLAGKSYKAFQCGDIMKMQCTYAVFRAAKNILH